jgi:hypothetical protein
METRPKRELFTFDCPNNSEYCFLRKNIAGQNKCVVHKKSIYFMCRYTQPVKTKETNG